MGVGDDDDDVDEVGEYEEGLASARAGGGVVGRGVGGGRSTSAAVVGGSCMEIREQPVATRSRSDRPELAPGQPPYMA